MNCWIRSCIVVPCCLLAAMASAQELPTADQATTQLDAAASSIVALESRIGERTLFGAGVIVARERTALWVVTANHVVRQGPAQANEVTARLRRSPGVKLKAELQPSFDRADDLALLRVPTAYAPGIDACASPLPKSGEQLALRRGHSVYAIGNPAGVAWRVPPRADDVADSSAREIRFQSSVIETGHSGGGLFNAFGDLIGLVRADQPPFGLALPWARVTEHLRVWGVAAGADGCAAATVTAPPRAQPNVGIDLRQTTMAQWGMGWQGDERRKPWFTALQRGDAAEVKRLFGTMPSRRDREVPLPPLHMAVAFGQEEVVKQLLLMGEPRNEFVGATYPEGLKLRLSANRWRDSVGTPLHVAARFGQIGFIRLLIASGATVNDGSDAGGSGPGSPLAVAATANQGEAVKALLAAGAKVDAGEDIHEGWMYTPLARAVAVGNLEMVKLLGSRPEKLVGRSEEGGPPSLLRVAARNGQIEVLQHLLSRRVPMSCQGRNMCETPVYDAILEGQIEALRLLLAAGADPNERGYQSALEIALAYRNLQAVQLLLKAGAKANSPTSDGKTVLKKALEEDAVEIAQALRAYGAKP